MWSGKLIIIPSQEFIYSVKTLVFTSIWKKEGRILRPEIPWLYRFHFDEGKDFVTIGYCLEGLCVCVCVCVCWVNSAAEECIKMEEKNWLPRDSPWKICRGDLRDFTAHILVWGKLRPRGGSMGPNSFIFGAAEPGLEYTPFRLLVQCSLYT